MTKTDFLKKLKAGLLAGTMAATLSACGEEPGQEKENTTTSIVTEETTDETKTTKVENTTKESKENTTNKEEKTENNTEVVENPTKGENKETKPNNTTSNNTTPTNKETKENTPSNTTKNNTTPVVTQRTQAPVTTRQQVTTQAPTTTKAVQTQAPTTTAAPVTQAPVTQPPVVNYDITLDNITKSADVFNAFADSMAIEIQRGTRIQIPDCNGENYWMYGTKEAKVALLLLNMNEPYENGVLAESFEGYSDYDIKNGILYLYRMAMIEEVTEVNIDWNDYTKDTETAEYMNKLMTTGKNARETGNMDDFNRTLNEYFENSGGNYASLVMTMGYIGTIRGNEYGSMTPEELFEFYAGNYPNEIKQLIH